MMACWICVEIQRKKLKQQIERKKNSRKSEENLKTNKVVVDLNLELGKNEENLKKRNLDVVLRHDKPHKNQHTNLDREKFAPSQIPASFPVTKFGVQNFEVQKNSLQNGRKCQKWC